MSQAAHSTHFSQHYYLANSHKSSPPNSASSIQQFLQPKIPNAFIFCLQKQGINFTRPGPSSDSTLSIPSCVLVHLLLGKITWTKSNLGEKTIYLSYNSRSQAIILGKPRKELKHLVIYPQSRAKREEKKII